MIQILLATLPNAFCGSTGCKPWGLEGGLDATGNEVAIKRNGTWKTDFPNAKVFLAQLKPGDGYRVRSGGGGGYGVAWERALDKVQHDVRQGYVSAAQAAALYGVMIDPATFEIDLASTEQRRAELRKAAG